MVALAAGDDFGPDTAAAFIVCVAGVVDIGVPVNPEGPAGEDDGDVDVPVSPRNWRWREREHETITSKRDDGGFFCFRGERGGFGGGSDSGSKPDQLASM